MRSRKLLTLTLTLLASAACSTTTPIGAIDTAGTTGSMPAGPTGGAGTGAQGPYVPSSGQTFNDQPFTTPNGVSADWTGYFENYFDPALETVRLHFGVDAQGQSTLSVVRGSSAPPAPPADAFDQWPVPVAVVSPDPVSWGSGPGPGVNYPSQPVAGFTYTTHEVRWEGSRLRFMLNMIEPWATWCALQTSYPRGSDSYGCNIETPDDAPVVPPGKCVVNGARDRQCMVNHESMCIGQKFCDCNATGCGAARWAMTFDITFYGDHADGSVMPFSNVRLMPVAP